MHTADNPIVSRQWIVILTLLLASSLVGALARASTLGDSTSVAVAWEDTPSIEALVDAVDAIVVGTVGSFVERVEFHEQDPLTGNHSLALAHDLHAFKADRVLKGDNSGSILVGRVDFGAPTANTQGFREGDHVLLFLDRFELNNGEAIWVPRAADVGTFEAKFARFSSRATEGSLAGVTVSIEEVTGLVSP